MVYVDTMKAGFGNMCMCHMIADTKEELLEMCDKIGVQRKWIQHEGEYGEHFDICLSKRKLALKRGAQEVNLAQIGEMWRRRKAGLPLTEHKTTLF